ncbi:MAG: hypothetical protein UU47_C0001G0015 [candidate division TM6 bacterium GW2011_GWE2_41_16]|nr:MAG: hypothetical protein UU47_C0001G0015 [candidate division TM6 bacterium GW2011_GWE2_41_16]
MNVVLLASQSREQFDAKYIECMTDEGNLTILPGHDAAMYVLAPKSQIILHGTDGVTTERGIERGVLEVSREEVLIVVG